MSNALRLAAATLALAIALPAVSLAQQGAPYVLAETGQGYSRLQDAVNAIGAGTGTIRVASGRHADCAVQSVGEVAFVAAVNGQAVFDGTACEGKAALVLRGRGARVEGLVFANIKVSDFNGAGIRLEKGALAVSQAWFRDSQQGILTGDDESATLSIDKSTFTRLGTCEGPGGCAHSVYTGNYGLVRVTRSRFEAGRGGHYLKSRAGKIDVSNNSFDDSAGKGTNYMIDLPGGASGRIAGNWFVQGADKENHSAFITVAPEGRQHDSSGLVIEGNDARFVPAATWPSTFVAVWGDETVQLGQNRLAAKLTPRDRR
ncbi:right-handed parallel beta-helix repeat-containing protein [Novosphingobium aquiterrae]|uniref:Right-handed parallel beta-helix repeat-containing protein n=1 Tax=Novosphingobium aquiterrae TaxID=624388 RepID=A0ABV6PJP2_9SPHN